VRDREGVTCDDSCEFAFDGVCDDGSEPNDEYYYQNYNQYQDDDLGGYYEDDDEYGDEEGDDEGEEYEEYGEGVRLSVVCSPFLCCMRCINTLLFAVYHDVLWAVCCLLWVCFYLRTFMLCDSMCCGCA
jgi:hypothetical protein